MAAAPALYQADLDNPYTPVPLEFYLKTSFCPDCEWVDGYKVERNVGELPHSRLQSFLVGFLAPLAQVLEAEVLCEQRVQVSPTRYRIPDVCLLPFGSGDERIVRTPPMLCIEIVSREDRIVDLHEKLEENRTIGVAS